MTIDVVFADHPAYDCRYDAQIRKTNITWTEMRDTKFIENLINERTYVYSYLSYSYLLYLFKFSTTICKLDIWQDTF